MSYIDMISKFELIVSSDETDASHFLDQKSRGLQGSKVGQVDWCFDSVEHHFNEGRYL